MSLEGTYFILSMITGLVLWVTVVDDFLSERKLKKDKQRTDLVKNLLKPENIDFNTYTEVGAYYDVDPSTFVTTFVYKNFVGHIYHPTDNVIYFFDKKEPIMPIYAYDKVNH